MLSVIAMSGGVDSSAAAALTAERRGPDAALGVALRLYSTEEHAGRSGRSCCAPDDLHDARRAFQLEEGVEQLDEQVLVRLRAEDALEDEVCLGVGEDRDHALI